MATKRNIKKSQTRTNNLGFFSEIKWGESYTSLFLGAVVVVVLLVLAFSFVKSRNFNNEQKSTSSATNQTSGRKNLPKTYTVKKGDDLWHIAENLYGSGYNWVDLAAANKITNPGVIFTETILTVPAVESRQATGEQIQVAQAAKPISGTSYKIVRGDDLWQIAVRAYGDGYKWVDIAKANKLTNPNLIHADNVLTLPR